MNGPYNVLIRALVGDVVRVSFIVAEAVDIETCNDIVTRMYKNVRNKIGAPGSQEGRIMAICENIWHECEFDVVIKTKPVYNRV